MDAPPKTLVTTMRQQTQLAQGPLPQGAPSYLQSFPRGAPGSLPVLEAFHQFLEKERIRARRRVLGVAWFFLILTIGFIGAGAGIGWFFFQQMRAELSAVQKDLATFADKAGDIRQGAEQALTSATAQGQKLAAEMAEGRRVMDASKADVAQMAKKSDASIAKLHESLAALEARDKALRHELAAWKQEQQTLATLIAQAARETPAVHPAIENAPGEEMPDSIRIDVPPPQETATPLPQETQATAAPVATDPSPAPSVRRTAGTLNLSINAEGQRNAVPWRMPIPE